MTVRRKPNGRWEVRNVLGGRRVGRTFDLKRDADAYDTWIERRKQLGEAAPPEPDVTVSDFVETYWRYYAVPNLSQKTRDVYKSVWKKHLQPRIGTRGLRELRPKVLSRLRSDLETAGVGAPTVLKAFTMLGSVLSYAVVEEKIPHNPVRDIRKPSQERERDIVIATPEQVEAVRAYLLDPPVKRDKRGRRVPRRDAVVCQRDATIVSLLAYAGLRTFSELHSRDWRHVGERALKVYASKTNKDGVVRLLAPLAQDLAELRLASGRPDPREPLVPRPDGRRLTATDWRNWRRRIFQPAAEAAGLDGMHPYDLRHAFASLLIWEGQSLAQVAEQLRHSVQTCSKTYIHVLEEYTPEKRVSAEQRIRQARDPRRLKRAR